MDGTVMTVIKTKKGDVKLPCLDVRVVGIDRVQANNYNPIMFL